MFGGDLSLAAQRPMFPVGFDAAMQTGLDHLV
jgi:hypothetical protein